MHNVVDEYRQLLVLHNYSWRVESHEIRSWLDNQIYIAKKYVDAQQCTAVTGLSAIWARRLVASGGSWSWLQLWCLTLPPTKHEEGTSEELEHACQP